MTFPWSENLENQVICDGGEAGRLWLNMLPARLATLQTELQIYELVPARCTGVHWIGHGLQQIQGRLIPVTLKMGLPDADFESETQALMHMQIHPKMVRLLEARPKQGWQLLERILPGTDLSDFKDDAESTGIWLEELTLLPATEPDRQCFPDARQWCQALWQRPCSPLLMSDLEIARKLCQDLLARESNLFFLHGDLHHQNMLQNAQGGWTVIDPKGLIAGPEFELGAMLRNPFPALSQNPDLTAQLEKRLERIACDKRFQLDRVIQWAYVQTVLAACWCQNEQAIKLWLKVAQALWNLAETGI